MRKLLNLLGFRRRRLEQDLDRELRYHLERRVEDLRKSGLSETEARRQAAIEFGGVAQVQEEVRDTWFSRWIHDVLRDVQYAGRTLRKQPGFTLVALLSLALGIGANAAIFGVFYAVLMRPLPYRNPDRLLSVAFISQDSPGGHVMTPEFVAWRVSSRSFEALTAWNDEQFNLTGAGAPERIVGASVTADFLSIIGVHPALGRSFSAMDDDTSGARALLTHGLWQRHFGSDLAIVGRVVQLNDKPCTIVGVLPLDFRFPGDLDPEILVMERVAAQPDWAAQTTGMLSVAGRLRDGMTADGALAELTAIHARHEADMPAWLQRLRKGARVQLVPLQERLAGNARPTLLLLLGAVGLLLLIACVNVASLQLGRATVRRREIGLRAALGASRARIARSLVVENLMLTGLAGIVGLLVAAGLLHLLRLFPGLPLWDPNNLRVSWAVGGAAFLLSTLSGLAIGLVPAHTSQKVDLNDVLKAGSRSLVTGSGTGLRAILVSAQVGLALILLLGSGLLLRSLHNVLVVDPGFEGRGVITARLNLPGSRYSAESKRAEFSRALVEHVSALPGVVAAGTTNALPLTGYTLGVTKVLVDGQPEPVAGRHPGTPLLIVSPGYFRAMGIRLLRGRPFENRDNQAGPRVAIASQDFARQFFSSEDVIGRRVRFGSSSDWLTIVGVSGDVRHAGREEGVQPELFVPASQMPSYRVNLAIRGNADPSSLAVGLRSVVGALDKNLPVYDIATMDERLWQSGESRSALTLLLSSFAFVAICLAAVGIYGVVSQAVQYRQGEIGLRMALGAEARYVRRMVMQRSMALAIAGVGVGSIAAFWSLRILAPMLHGIELKDTATFVSSGLVLILVALLASYLPARRASRIDPLAALRCE